MAAEPAPRFGPAKTIVIKGRNVKQDSEIFNEEDVQFRVENFEGKKYCNLMIYAVAYTDDGVAPTNTGESLPAPTPVLLGTIKIGS